jgi:hypothetical protein
MVEKYGTSKGTRIKIDKKHVKSIIPYLKQRYLLKKLRNISNPFLKEELISFVLDLPESEFNNVYDNVKEKGLTKGLEGTVSLSLLKQLKDDYITRNTEGED